jgi:hypothetical protein
MDGDYAYPTTLTFLARGFHAETNLSTENAVEALQQRRRQPNGDSAQRGNAAAAGWALALGNYRADRGDAFQLYPNIRGDTNVVQAQLGNKKPSPTRYLLHVIGR